MLKVGCLRDWAKKNIELGDTQGTSTTPTSSESTGKTLEIGQKTIDLTINVNADENYIHLFKTVLYICLAEKPFNDL